MVPVMVPRSLCANAARENTMEQIVSEVTRIQTLLKSV
jgi:hypothetical protein